MCKKIGIAALAIVAGVFIVKSTHLGAYARTAWDKVKSTAKSQVPLEFQIETLRSEVARLTPDMKSHCNTIAREMVEVQRLRNEVVDIRTNLDHQKELVRAMTQELKSGATKVVLNSRTYSADRIRDKLVRDLASCKRCSDELRAKEQLLEARERGLEAAREQLSSMKAQKEQLEVKIAQLEADVKTLRVAQTQSNFQLDDSRLASIKAQLADIETQLKVEKTAGDLLGAFSNDFVDVEKKAPSAAQVIRDADEFLGTDSSKPDGDVVGKK
jgi:chromosome segregation ATPase